MRIEAYSDKYYPQVLSVIENFHAEAVGDYVGLFEPESATDTIKLFDGENASNAFLLIVDDVCQGVFAGMEYKSMTSGGRIFQEIIWYVNKDFRGQGVRFFKEVENILKSRGISLIIMAVLENSKTIKIKRLYEILGYRPMEVHYIKNLKD